MTSSTPWADIGRSLETQAAVVVNLLLAGQDAEARARLAHAEEVLRPGASRPAWYSPYVIAAASW